MFNYERNREMVQMHKGNWSILCDEEYNGLPDELRVVCSRKKKRVNGWFIVADKSSNECTTRHCVLVENKFGR